MNIGRGLGVVNRLTTLSPLSAVHAVRRTSPGPRACCASEGFALLPEISASTSHRVRRQGGVGYPTEQLATQYFFSIRNIFPPTPAQRHRAANPATISKSVMHTILEIRAFHPPFTTYPKEKMLFRILPAIAHGTHST